MAGEFFGNLGRLETLLDVEGLSLLSQFQRAVSIYAITQHL